MNMIEESKIANPRFSRVLAIAQQLGMSLPWKSASPVSRATASNCLRNG